MSQKSEAQGQGRLMSISAESQPQSQSQREGRRFSMVIYSNSPDVVPDLMLSGFILQKLVFRVRTRRRRRRAWEEGRFKRYHNNVPAFSHL